MAEKARRLPPVAHNDQDGAQREQLADLNANVEGNQVDKQAIGRNFKFFDFGRQTKTVEEPEDKRCRFNWSTQQLCENMGLRRFFE